MSRRKRASRSQQVESYQHPQAHSPMRPDVGTQSLFRKKKAPQKYVYDDSLSPALEWDGQNPAREQGEAAIEEIRLEFLKKLRFGLTGWIASISNALLTFVLIFRRRLTSSRALAKRLTVRSRGSSATSD